MTELLGCEDVLVLPTITHIHTSVIPVLVGDGTIFLDGRAHKTIYDGAMYAAGHGATIVRFRHDDPDHLAELLGDTMFPYPRVIALDGVNSMTGNAPDLAPVLGAGRGASGAALRRRCPRLRGDRRAHRRTSVATTARRATASSATSTSPTTTRCIVAGFSKSYSSLLAFLALPTSLKNALKVLAPPYLYSGPSPVASLATVIAGLDVNRHRGDEIRANVWRKTHRVLEALDALGIDTPNTSGLPIIEIPLADHETIDEVGRYLFDHGIYATMAAFPLVPATGGRVPDPDHRGQRRRRDRGADLRCSPRSRSDSSSTRWPRSPAASPGPRYLFRGTISALGPRNYSRASLPSDTTKVMRRQRLDPSTRWSPACSRSCGTRWDRSVDHVQPDRPGLPDPDPGRPADVEAASTACRGSCSPIGQFVFITGDVISYNYETLQRRRSRSSSPSTRTD